jgi:hypothetical protein
MAYFIHEACQRKAFKDTSAPQDYENALLLILFLGRNETLFYVKRVKSKHAAHIISAFVRDTYLP